MRLADIGNRNGPRCLVQHESRGSCDCEEAYVDQMVQRALRRNYPDWRELYRGEVAAVQERLTVAHDRFLEEGDYGSMAVANTALQQILLVDPDDFKELDEVWR